MPLLDSESLAALREQQKGAALIDTRCRHCSAQLWPNYCRECDEHFMDGHYTKWETRCNEATAHQSHRKY